MMDLIIFYSPDKACMTYYINNDQAGYKIEYPFSHIKNIYLENGDAEVGKSGGLVVELNRPPNFFMDSSGSGGFFQCGDFTEDQQVSVVMSHYLGGHPKILSDQLTKLLSLDSFMNRHESSSFFPQGQDFGGFPNTFMNHDDPAMVDQLMMYDADTNISDDMYSKHSQITPRDYHSVAATISENKYNGIGLGIYRDH